MKFTRIAAIAVIAASVGIGTLHAQSFRSQPAEFPPTSYKGKQYVDSTGCVFIRAGIDGNVTWVPRVSRSRDAICGFKPTNVGVAAAKPAPRTEAAVQITLNAAPAQRAPAPRIAATPRPAPMVAPKVVRQVAPQPARQVAVAQRAPLATAQMAPQGSKVTCPGRSALSQRYTGASTKRAPVRCGPQAATIVGTPRPVASAAAGHPAPGTITATTRIVPRHVAINRLNTIDGLTVPEGYRAVWEDGRLNPKRAEQTLAGRDQMHLIWTDTVPRRLIDQANGRDMTAKLPLVYPFLMIMEQRRDLGEVTIERRNGQVVKRIVRNPGVPPITRQPVYSTRSASKAAPKADKVRATADARGGRYVQVGVFANSDNAQKTAQRIARMGMPARIGKSTRGGKTYLSVQAGPFAGGSASGAALRSLRGIGFKDAYVR